MTLSRNPSPALLAAVALFAAITPAVLLTAPAIASQLAVQLQLEPARIGDLFAVELGAMSLATLPSLYWLKRVDWRLAGLLAALGFILANLASAQAVDYHTLLGLRGLSAFCGGSLMILCLSCAAGMPNPSRAYGIWVLGQLVLGAIGLALLPRLYQAYGLGAGYLALAALMLLALPLIRAFPAGASAVASGGSQQPAPARWKVLTAILGLFGFYVALSAVWTFVGAIGARAGLSATLGGEVLAVATLAGIVGAGCASLIGERWRRERQLVAGFSLMALAILLLLGDPPLARFALAALLFKFTWTYALPFILASLAELDASGRLMSLSNLVIGAGLALGPAIGGRLIGADGSFQNLLPAAAALTVLALPLILGSRPRAATATPQPL